MDFDLGVDLDEFLDFLNESCNRNCKMAQPNFPPQNSPNVPLDQLFAPTMQSNHHPPMVQANNLNGFVYKQQAESHQVWPAGVGMAFDMQETSSMSDSGVASNSSSVYSQPTGDGLSEDMDLFVPASSTPDPRQQNYNPSPQTTLIQPGRQQQLAHQSNHIHHQSSQFLASASRPPNAQFSGGNSYPPPPAYPRQHIRQQTFTTSQSAVQTQQNPVSTQIPNQFNLARMQFGPSANHQQFPVESGQSVANKISELILFLQESDDEIIQEASSTLNNFCTDHISAIIANTSGLLQQILNSTRFFQNPNAHSAIVKLLYALSRLEGKAGRDAILNAGGIAYLVQNLSGQPAQQIKSYIITVLHTVLRHTQSTSECNARAKQELIQHQGIEALVATLDAGSPKFLYLVLDCLKSLITKEEHAKIRVFNANGAARILRIFHAQSQIANDRELDEKLLNIASNVLKIISVEAQNKQAILNNHGLEILVSCLRRNFPRSVVPVGILVVLRNLSDMVARDAEFREKDLDFLLEPLVPLLTERRTADGKVHSLLKFTAGILTNLTSGSARNKIKVVQLNGIQLLIQACGSNPNDDEFLETCMITLRHLIVGHAEVQQARQMVLQARGLEVMSNILNSRTRIDVIKATVACLQPLSHDPRTHVMLRNSGVFQRLVGLTGETCLAVQSKNFKSDAVFQVLPGTNVRMSELLANLIGALSNFSDESSMRDLIRHPELNRMLVQLLHRYLDEGNYVENVVRTAVVYLSKMAQDVEGAGVLENQHTMEALYKILNRPATNTNIEIAHRAASTIVRVYAMKSANVADITREMSEVLVKSGYGTTWNSNPVQSNFDYMSTMDDFRNYHSSGPPSVYGGSIYSSCNQSTYDPSENLSGMDMAAPYTPNPQIQQQQWDFGGHHNVDASNLHHQNAYPMNMHNGGMQ